jgi:anti-sigma B factor antagonist
MKIDKTVYDDHAVLTLKGEFDSFYCPKLQEEVDALIGDGMPRVVLNMRLVKFINSTALGAIIKAFKRCKAEGGHLALSRPSTFARTIIQKLGIDQLVPMFDSDEEAEKAVVGSGGEGRAGVQAPEVEEGGVLITFPDETRGRQANPDKRRFTSTPQRTVLGTMLNVGPERLQFSWSGAKQGLTQDQAMQLFFKGSDLDLKFQIKLFKKGYFDIGAKVQECARGGEDGSVKVTVSYTRILESELEALRQFAADMDFLKKQLPGS